MAERTAEQGRSSPDIAHLLDLEGLPPAHWVIILWRLPVSRNAVDRKIAKYGEVYGVAGQDTNLHHRLILGRRHWNRIAELDVNYRGLHGKKSLLFLRISRVNPQLAQEVRAYAQEESNQVYTIEDFFHEELGRAMNPGYNGWFWDERSKEWKVKSTHPVEVVTRYGDITICDSSESRLIDIEYIVPVRRLKWDRSHAVRVKSSPFGYETVVFQHNNMLKQYPNNVQENWLLTEEEAPNFFTHSPDELTQFARKIPPAELRERLMAKTPQLTHLHGSPYFGNWEREIA